MRKDDGKAPMHLIPPWVLEPLAQLYDIGAEKYGAWNYIEHPQAWSRVSSAMERHVTKWKAGERYDQTDGQHHMLSVIWGAMTLYIYETYGLGEDDRPPILHEGLPEAGPGTVDHSYTTGFVDEVTKLATEGLLGDTVADYLEEEFPTIDFVKPQTYNFLPRSQQAQAWDALFGPWFTLDEALLDKQLADRNLAQKHQELAEDFSKYVGEYWADKEKAAEVAKASEVYNAKVVEENMNPSVVPGWADTHGCGDDECECEPI